MIKFKATAGDGRPIIGFGLSEENIKRLKNDEPIFVKLSDLGMGNAVVVIFYGETEAKMAEYLKKNFNVAEERGT